MKVQDILSEAPLPPDWDPAEFKQQGTTFKSRLAYALDRAQKIGAGSSRVAMTIEYQGRQTVLKIAKNRKGLAQNAEEVRILDDGYASQLHILIPLIDYDREHAEPLWVQTELARPTRETELCDLIKCPNLNFLISYARSIEGRQLFLDQPRAYQEKMREIGKTDDEIEQCTEYANTLAELSGSFDIELNDFVRAANWGIYQGRPVVIDLGFTSDTQALYRESK